MNKLGNMDKILDWLKCLEPLKRIEMRKSSKGQIFAPSSCFSSCLFFTRNDENRWTFYPHPSLPHFPSLHNPLFPFRYGIQKSLQVWCVREMCLILIFISPFMEWKGEREKNKWNESVARSITGTCYILVPTLLHCYRYLLCYLVKWVEKRSKKVERGKRMKKGYRMWVTEWGSGRVGMNEWMNGKKGWWREGERKIEWKKRGTG